ncbi:MAG TPA: universal stress protein [Flavobacteriales bacterium]|nr:universal stress protein [Flavobacteriales bacterium]
MDKRAYLVPHDFTSVGDAAAKKAVRFALQSNASVHFLHIVKSASDKPTATKKLEEIINGFKTTNAPNIEFHIHVEAGNIFTDIAKVADAIHASLIIMGTHGAKGMQKVFGSFAIKVITSAHAPFVIVQEKTKTVETIKKIVFPINLNSETLQVSKIAGVLATDFKSEVHVVAPKEKMLDLSQKLIIYSQLVKKELAKINVPVHVEFLDKTKAYHTEILKYAKKINAELIALTYHSDRMMPQFDPFTQSIITNEDQIPVLVINGKDAGNYFY